MIDEQVGKSNLKERWKIFCFVFFPLFFLILGQGKPHYRIGQLFFWGEPKNQEKGPI